MLIKMFKYVCECEIVLIKLRNQFASGGKTDKRIINKD